MSGEADGKDSAAGIEFHCVRKVGVLKLTCNRESFRRLRDQVLAEAGWTDGTDEFQAIVIQHRFEARKSRKSGWDWVRDRIALIGCATLAFPFAFTLIVGAWTIIGWFR